MNRKETDLDSIEAIKEQINILEDKYNDLDKEYMEYKEADMNREAGQVERRKHKVFDELELLNSKLKLKELVEKERKDKTIALQRKIDIYEHFLNKKGLFDEFQIYELEKKIGDTSMIYKYDGTDIFPNNIKSKYNDCVLTKVNDGLYENAYIPEYANYKGDKTLIADVEKYEIVEPGIKNEQEDEEEI